MINLKNPFRICSKIFEIERNLLMKYLLYVSLILMHFSLIFADDNNSPIKVPYYIILNKYTNKDTYKQIRWVKWTDEQKKKLFLFSLELGKNQSATQLENAEKMQVEILATITESQKKEFTERILMANELKSEINKSLSDFEAKTKELNAAPFDINLYDVLISTRFFYFPETWAITRTPLNAEEKQMLLDTISHLSQIEQGFHLASEKTSEDLNKDYNILDFNMKKDFGTPALVETTKKFSKEHQEVFESLLKHYLNQKANMFAIYQKYGEKTKFELPLPPPKIYDPEDYKKPEERKK